MVVEEEAMKKLLDYEAMILEAGEENDGEGGGGDGSDKAHGPSCSECHYVLMTPSEMKKWRTRHPCNCR